MTAAAKSWPVVVGAGGKSGSSGGSESPDTLRSTQIADVVDLLSEGEVQGLTNGLRSIYLDGVPLQNADGSFNFDDVQTWFTAGTQGQPSITGANGVEAEFGVGVEVTATTPVVRTINDPAVDRCRVTIAVPQLSTTDTGNGNVTGSTFTWAIELQSAGGGFVEVARDTVTGKTMSRYARSKTFALTGPAPWDVRVKRITADSTSAYLVNAFQWQSYTEIKSLRLRHPNSALNRLRINAKAFGRVPVRAFDLCGLRVQVPTNYDPIAKTYTGVWDGTFKIAWTDCPAWIYHAVLTHTRYGLGRYFTVGEQVKWDLYTIGRRCDELVPDGYGGMEPRFRCGVELRTREQAYKVLQDLAAIFLGMAYWGGLDVAVVQDAPADPAAVYTPANVVDGRFVYAGTSHSARNSQVTVWWNDITQMGKLVPETVIDTARERRFGVRPLTLSPLGTWSRGQARRLAKWALYSQRHQAQTVAFRVGLDGVLTPPGKFFQIADPHEAGERLGGRVREATASSVRLDAEVTLAAGETYTLTVMLPDPADPAKLAPQARTVTTAAGARTVLEVSPPFGAAPAAAAVWLLQSDAVQATWWRCLTLKEVPDTAEFEITGVEHYPAKHDAVEQGADFEEPPVSRISAVAPQPDPVTITEVAYLAGSAYRTRATVSWREPAPGLRYAVSWRVAAGPWVDVLPTTANVVDVDVVAYGLMDVRVVSINALGSRSKPAVQSAVLRGRSIGVGAQLNVGDLAGTLDWNEALLHGRDAAGVPVDAAGSIYVAGGIVPVPYGKLYTSRGPARGWVMWDAAGSLWAMASGTPARPFVFVRKVGAQWFYDDNAAWVPFAPLSTAYLIGSMETAAADTDAAPGITSMVMWADAQEPEAVASALQAAQAAQAAASAAAEAAADAQEAAAEANGVIAGMVSDGILSRDEKPDLILRWQVLAGEAASIDDQATSFGITTEKDAFNAAVNALSEHLGSLAPPWDDATADTSLGAYGGRSALRAKWREALLAKQVLLDKIAAVAAQRASWNNVSGRPSDDAIKNNLVDVPWWQPGGTIPWAQNGELNSIVAGVGPKGGTDALWYCKEVAGNGDQGGGWDGGGPIVLDPSRTYRFVLPIRRVSGGGLSLWGIASDSVEVLNGEGQDFSAFGRPGLTTSHPNPYFAGGYLGHTDRWFLFVGYIFAAGSTGALHVNAGVWDCKTGANLGGGANFRFKAGQGTIHHRAYQYYASPGAEQLFGRPMVNLVDGTEPSLRECFEAAAILNSALEPSITAAQGAANAAANAAAAAQEAADAANGVIAGMVSDGVLSRDEKPALILEWNILTGAQEGIDGQAANLGITSERTNFSAAVNALAAHLGSMSPTWSDATADTNLAAYGGRIVLQTKWSDALLAKQALLDKIASVAAQRATWAGVSGRPKSFRVVSRGGSDTQGPAIGSGLFDGESDTALVGAARSYTLVRVRRADGVITFYRGYDVYGVGASGGFAAADLAADLNATTSASIVVVYGHDEPMNHRFDDGLAAAMYRCGASRAVFGSPLFRFRAGYVLVAIGGCGEGNGYESYQGAADSDAAAWCDVAFQIQGGTLLVTGTGATPRSLADYSYTGDLNATYGATLGVNVGGQAGTPLIEDNAVTALYRWFDADGFLHNPAIG